MKICTKLIISGLLIIPSGCSKSDFLDKKPNTSIVVPGSLDDMAQLLDNQTIMQYNAPALGNLSSDEYIYPTKAVFNAVSTKTERNCYIWNSDIYQGETSIQDWNAPYKAIFTANVVLDEFDKLSESDQSSPKGRFIKAWALFERGYNNFNLVQTFAPVFQKSTAATDLGIPLKTSSDINKISQRSTLQQSYDAITDDIMNALKLFSNAIPTQFKGRPSKAAAFALLARIYLYQQDYTNAGVYADSSLLNYSELIDYNTIDTTASNPFDIYNKEILLYSITNLNYSAVTVGVGPSYVDTALIKLYDDNDLRKAIFFIAGKEFYSFKIGYNAIGYYPFTGLAVDEVYLIRAECLARNEDLPGALSVLNKLLINRYRTNYFIPFTSNSQKDILNRILSERRKELVWRGIRWNDIKRLNISGANITLTRNLDGTITTLPPNDPRYTMPIPQDEIALSHIQQNIR